MWIHAYFYMYVYLWIFLWCIAVTCPACRPLPVCVGLTWVYVCLIYFWKICKWKSDKLNIQIQVQLKIR